PPRDPPGVVAVIPARDEAASIGAVIASHAGADYPGAFAIIIVDDNSSDATAENAARAALAEGFIGDECRRSFTRLSDGRRIEIITAPALEAGWSGKLSAVQTGLDHAAAITPDAAYILLTDADIVLAKPTLSALVAKAQTNNLALASLMARLDARGFWGGLLVPAFVYFFQKLYPFHAANDASSDVAAAAGGCMLADRRALDAIDGVRKIRGALIDDCALARALRDNNGKLWIGLARDEAVSLRDNRTL
ncbi:MAG: glycosyltransferase, partial [Parvularculaceae bacterium]|nr:glycosyltransferase [Parvularculaceae bacterium]